MSLSAARGVRPGAVRPDWLLERRRRAESALTTMLATCCLLGLYAPDGDVLALHRLPKETWRRPFGAGKTMVKSRMLIGRAGLRQRMRREMSQHRGRGGDPVLQEVRVPRALEQLQRRP